VGGSSSSSSAAGGGGGGGGGGRSFDSYPLVPDGPLGPPSPYDDDPYGSLRIC
jgi:hypothetical protein